ncbi:MAG TPA: type VI secretion system tube protein Hcp [Verrucomicrobiae bacterium]|jgi:type VI secretion system secreted protein Hcp|nr:type VI secretion system tube protein Hcp [Verrucomicrobiae bacterium]
MRRGLTRVAFALALAAVCCASRAADSAYLLLPGVPGDSTDAAHPKWINLQGFQFGVASPGAGGPRFADLSIAKVIDSASPALAQASATGAYFSNATLQVAQSTDNLLYQITLDNVWVTGVSSAASATNTVFPEDATLRFGKISWTYVNYNKDGSVASNTVTSWDLLYGKIPLSLGVAGVQDPASGSMQITFPVSAGATYRILGSSQVNGPYTLVETIAPSSLGPLTVSVPTAGSMLFFRVQELP